MQRITSHAARLILRLAGTLLGAALAVVLATGIAAAAPAPTSSASAYSGNFNWQQVSQDQKTDTLAVPVTILSGNAVSVLSSGDTTSNSFSGVVVAPTQSSQQSNEQSSSARAYASRRAENCGCARGSDPQARASSRNSSVQQSDQRQKTDTVAVPVTLLSGNAVSVLSSGNTTSNSTSGVVVAPSQSSQQSNVQHSSSHAQAVGSPYGSFCQHGCSHKYGKSGSSARASSHNSSVQQVSQRQKTATVAVPVTLLSGNAVSVLSSGNTTSNSNSGVVVAPQQSNSQSNVQSSAASATSSLAGAGN